MPPQSDFVSVAAADNGRLCTSDARSSDRARVRQRAWEGATDRHEDSDRNRGTIAWIDRSIVPRCPGLFSSDMTWSGSVGE